MSAVHPELPTPGRIVEVRGSIWAVTDVREQGLPRSSPDETVAELQHAITLQSLGEDNLGDELRVIWELEVGHSVAPDQGLPETIDGFDDPDKLGAFVDAARWGAVTSADDSAYQAPFRSGITIEAYQLEPLRRALQSARTNLLLADDVGLGKTIEAGLVITELLLRHRAHRVIVVCPPSLSIKWADEMREKFGLEFTIVNSERVAELRRTHGLNANPFRLFPRVIVSMSWLRTARAQRLLRDLYADADASTSARQYAFDLLVVDEAHHVAPASPPRSSKGFSYAVDSQRTISTRALADRCEHRLFLSATPHNGHSESFTALLAMIDNRRFERGVDLTEDALSDVVIRRLKSQITDKNFKPRIIKQLPYEPTPSETDHYAELVDILQKSKKLTGREYGGDLAGMLLKKRFFSSPVAFGRTLAAFTELTTTTGKPNLFDDDDEVLRETVGSEQSDEEEGYEDHPEFQAIRLRAATHPVAAATTAQLTNLIDWGLSYQAKPDSRLRALLTFLNGVCRTDGQWSNERVVVFTEYADTVDWLAEVLSSQGYADRLAVIQGSTDADTRETIRQQFTADPSTQPVRVLLATDSAGEGIDLQAHCHRLVNFDIPFNPSRLEQRIGRIDRYGQRNSPEIYHLVPTASSDTYAAEGEFLAYIARKVATIAADLGSVNAVIDHEIQQRYSPSPRRMAPIADKGAEIINRTLAGSLELNRQLTELSQSYGQRRIEMHLTPANTERVVSTALELAHQPPLREVGDTHTDAAVFAVPDFGPAWVSTIAGLTTRLDANRRRITFDEDAAQDRTDLVHIHLGHPLLQRSARLLRKAMLTGSELHRVTAVVLDDLDTSCVAAVSRLVLVGAGGLRLHEEVFLTGIRIGAQELAAEKVEALLDRALDAGDHTVASPDACHHLTRLWNEPDSPLRSRLERAVARRAEARRDRVSLQLTERETTDLARVHEIFAAFRRNLNDSIARLRREEEQYAQMLDFADDQREQRRRDQRTMENRLDTLAAEEQRELAAIRARYTDVTAYISSAAVVFAVTPADNGAWL